MAAADIAANPADSAGVLGVTANHAGHR
ncbi:uncharacterized protein METZ01_LOCUS517584, partial [marine metagenome]